MDKYEYKVRSEEISNLIEKEKYAEAVKIADTIDWRRVKSAAMLLKIAALYRISRRNEDSREMLMLAYERYPTNRSVVYSLCELSIELDDVVAAIEYYKQFAKLAPKDNGVYTLRYRILEAQEASLEERIEILEELKKKDYQEEWAYELAYLYHRVGLSTKCVEECDDIILWFGDGPYVMKAMELKAKHVPLTTMQQQNYEIMLGNAGRNYSSGNYDTENYDAGDYDGQNYSAEGYDQQNYDGTGYDEQNYSAEGYDQQNYGETGYNEQNYSAGGYDQQNYNETSYAEQDYSNESYDTQNYDTVNYNDQSYGYENDSNEPYGNGYEQENYAGESYENGYGQENTPSEQYIDENYDQQNYADEQFAEEDYSQENYPNEQYVVDGYSQGNYQGGQYAQNNYVDDGYGNLSYVDDSYQDNSYTSEFYVEQAYDENGNLISPEMYADSEYVQDNYGYPQGEGGQDNSYTGQTGASKEYRNGLHLVENTAPPAGNSGDMSQYNTINLQKVVAESMKELFPDDNDDVFAEDREKYNSGADIGNTAGDTRIFASVSSLKAAKNTTDELAGSRPQTGRVNIAQMVTGVSEKAPEPHTGAIKKVFVPGDDARSIKSDSNIEELRDTTERSVNDEHNRMEHNDENVYHEQSIMDRNETDETSQAESTGPMKLDDVLVEWERMKQDNAKKHQQEIKKRVLTQTGKIFADFDHSIKSGILGELEREEEEAQRRNEKTSSTSVRGNDVTNANKGRDGFLDADVTGDIPQQPVSEDDFDVEYVTDQKQPIKLQESAKLEEYTKDAELEQAKEQELAVDEEEFQESDRIAVHGSGIAADEMLQEEAYTEQDSDEEADKYAQSISTEHTESDAYLEEADQETAKNYETDGEVEAEYGTKAEYEAAIDAKPAKAEDRKAEYDAAIDAKPAKAEDSTYTQKIYAESVDGYNAENASYTGEMFAEDTDGYAEEEDPESTSEYTEEVYAESTGQYTGESYAEDVGAYTEEVYAESTGQYAESYAEDAGAYTEEVYAESTGQYNEKPYVEDAGEYTAELYTEGAGEYTAELYTEDAGEYTAELYAENTSEYIGETYAEGATGYTEETYAENASQYTGEMYTDPSYMEDPYDDLEDAYSDTSDNLRHVERRQNDRYDESDLDPEDAESIAEMAKEDALKTQEIKMNTADLSSLSEKIVATTKKEASGARREEIRDFTPEEQTLFENFAVTRKIRKQIIYALENMTLAAYTGNVIITGDAGLDTVRMAKNLIKEYQASDEGFSGKLAKITGEKINQRNIKDVFEKLNNGGIIIEKANGMSEEKLYELATNLNQDTLGIVVIMEDTKKEITKLLEKQAMIVDYFNIRIDLMEMDNNALVAYAKNYALALEYSIDELGTLALYTRIANMQSGNHVVTKDEVRDIIDEAIWKSKKSKIKNFVDVLFARRYDNEDMIVLKERDFM